MGGQNTMDECSAAELSTNDFGYNIVRAAQLLLGVIIIALLIKIIVYYRKNHPITLHGNLLIIIVNVLLFYATFCWAYIIMSARNFVLALTYSNPCECLTPVWLVFLLRMPFYAYIAASPMLHFAIMVERVRATIFVRSYEREGRKFGFGIVAFTTLLTVSFCFCVYITSILDSQLTGKPMVYFTLTSKYNSAQLIYVHYFFLFLVICISVADYVLIRMNKKFKKKLNCGNAAGEYSLSGNYQTNENILTMRIIFPLDFSYTIFFSIFNILSYYIRSKREEVGLLIYMRTYEAFVLLLFVHALITLAVYQYFMVRSKANKMAPQIQSNVNEQANVYFRNLRSQWK